MLAPQGQWKRVPDLGSAEPEGALELTCSCPSKRQTEQISMVRVLWMEIARVAKLIIISKYAGARPWNPLNTSMHFR